MYFLYSILLTIGFLLLSPLFIARRRKYAAGFGQRLGRYPHFVDDGRPVIWLHCVSVGEVNAARPLVDEINRIFTNHQLVISTVTRTGQELAQNVFSQKASAIFYFPFDWKFSVRRALRLFRPSLVLLIETEIWPRFIYEARRLGCRTAIVNGRLSEKSARGYARGGFFVRNVLANIDFALMQSERDAARIISVGMAADKVAVTGNIKFDYRNETNEDLLKQELQQRFAIDAATPLILAASTHKPEELWILNAVYSSPLTSEGGKPRLMIAPRHPERFDSVANEIESFIRSSQDAGMSLHFARRSQPQLNTDAEADIILLDSIGELRAAYNLAEIVFVGGSLIPHGGQNVIEPAAAGKAILTGPFTHNFADIISNFLKNDALIQLADGSGNDRRIADLRASLAELIADPDRRAQLGANAVSTLQENRGAVEKTLAALRDLL